MQIVEIIQSDSERYNILYKNFKDWDYLYNFFFEAFATISIYNNEKLTEKTHISNITNDFYEGFEFNAFTN